jgi:hypothetical protein
VREELRAAQAAGAAAPAAAPAAGGPEGASDALLALADALTQLRSSLRSASDEAVMISEPADSAQVVTGALSQATEQMEAVRTQVRTLSEMFGITE